MNSDKMEEFSGRRRDLGQSKRKAVGAILRSNYFIDTDLELLWMVSSLTQFLKMKYLGDSHFELKGGCQEIQLERLNTCILKADLAPILSQVLPMFYPF